MLTNVRIKSATYLHLQTELLLTAVLAITLEKKVKISN